MGKSVETITKKYSKSKERLMDILLDLQSEMGYITKDAVKEVAEQLGISQVSVQQTLSFYHFFSQKPKGKYSIYLNNSVVANMMGRENVKKVFEQEAGCKFGKVTEDGLIGLFNTSCIGMNDQEPAALINVCVLR